MFTSSPAVRIANRRQYVTEAACRPSVIRHPSASRAYMRREGSRITSSATGPSPAAAARMRDGPMCQMSPTSVRNPMKRRVNLSTDEEGGPSDPRQHDPEQIRTDRRQPEEPLQLANEREEEQHQRKVPTRHVLHDEICASGLGRISPRTPVTESSGTSHHPE